MIEECSSSHWYRAMPKELPVWLLSGEKDPVGAMGAGPREVHRRLTEAGCRDVGIKLYPEGRHELFNDLEKEEAKADLLAWMNRVMEGSAS